jgi:hypothetical protein
MLIPNRLELCAFKIGFSGNTNSVTNIREASCTITMLPLRICNFELALQLRIEQVLKPSMTSGSKSSSDEMVTTGDQSQTF